MHVDMIFLPSSLIYFEWICEMIWIMVLEAKIYSWVCQTENTNWLCVGLQSKHFQFWVLWGKMLSFFVWHCHHYHLVKHLANFSPSWSFWLIFAHSSAVWFGGFHAQVYNLHQGLARPDFDWKCLSLNDKTETKTEKSKSQWQDRDRDWKSLSLNDETGQKLSILRLHQDSHIVWLLFLA